MSLARFAARAQVFLSFVFIGGYFFLLSLFVLGKVHTPVEWRDTLQSLLSVLTGGVILIIGYWFSRQRPNDQDTSTDK